MWYDAFSLVYDRALEDLYAPFRPAAVEALQLSDGEAVLDCPCGTGQSLDGLVEAVGPTGTVVGVDASAGMLRRANRRVHASAWRTVRLEQVRAEAMTRSWLARNMGITVLDGVLCALGLTALPEWESTFDQLFSCLRSGGRFVLFDVYAEERTRQTASVEWVARADLSREAWRPLEARCEDFERTVLPADPKTFGGDLYVASGTKA